MIGRESLERHQVWCYLAAVALGLGAGSAWPGFGPAAEALVWPVLALLLYATFVQIPLAGVPRAFQDARFFGAALLGNFVILPLVVWALLHFAPVDSAVRLGLLLVLLVPCTDWFITFSQLGGGDARLAVALTPVTLLLQLLLLPGYLWLFAGEGATAALGFSGIWPALLVVLLPLASAALTQAWAGSAPRRRRMTARIGWLPVPLLSAVILLVTAANLAAVRDNLHSLPVVLGIALAFLAAALIVAKLLSLTMRLGIPEGRTLAFSLATRNSFMVLPFALALPAGWETASIVIVMQSLVELFGMICCLWFVPRVLFRARTESA